MAETKRTGIIDKDWGNILANVVESTATPWTYGLVALNPDWSDIGWPASAIVIWNPVVGWNPWRILYIDQSGNLFGDDAAVRDSGVQKQTTIGSGTYAQGNANDWVSAEVYFQADNIGDTGNSISLVFDGVDDADTVLNAWNTANPWNTASIVDWLGTTVPTAGTRPFIGWWEIIYESGTVNNGISTFFQGSGSTLLDTTNGKIWFSTTGNLISVIWEPSLWFVAASIDFNTGNLWAMVVSDSGINFFVTDQSTYNARLQGDDVEIILVYNGTYLWVNGLSWPLWWDSSSNRYILPTNVTPSVGDTLAVAGISGNDYALDFVAWWWTPAGADTEIQYNNSGAFWASSDFVFNNTKKTFKVMSSANNLLLVDAATGDYWLGDLDGIGNSTRLFIDDTIKAATIATGWDRIRLDLDWTAFTAKIWDSDSLGNDTLLTVDDANQEITLDLWVWTNLRMILTGLNSSAGIQWAEQFTVDWLSITGLSIAPVYWAYKIWATDWGNRTHINVDDGNKSVYIWDVNTFANGTILTVDDANSKITVNKPFWLQWYTVATLPTWFTGAMAYVTDALAPAFGATVVWGWAVVMKVRYDGSNWIVW